LIQIVLEIAIFCKVVPPLILGMGDTAKHEESEHRNGYPDWHIHSLITLKQSISSRLRHAAMIDDFCRQRNSRPAIEGICHLSTLALHAAPSLMAVPSDRLFLSLPHPTCLPARDEVARRNNLPACALPMGTFLRESILLPH
jgi:hypothetical protein